MTFLQPTLLWALPLMLVPVVIHLLNRMRYRSRRWAAMSFLMAASKQSQRQAKLRHLLLLLCRALVIGALVVAIARPLAGGWLGWALHSAPETVVVVLDRSPSMEATDGQTGVSKREAAVRQLLAAGSALGGRSHFVLIDNTGRGLQELFQPGALGEESVSGPTDAGADVPAMLAAAGDYLAATQPGRTEIWLASDLQESSWRPEASRWASVAARLNALPQAVRVRLLALSQPATNNVAVAVAGVRIQRGIASGSAGASPPSTPLGASGSQRPEPGDLSGGRGSRRADPAGAVALDLALDFRRGGETAAAVPVTLSLGGARTQFEVKLAGREVRAQKRVDIGLTPGPGWGWVELPADANLRDNRSYFAFDPGVPLRGVVVADDARVGRLLTLAVAPLIGKTDQSCVRITAVEFANYDLTEVALVVWAAAARDEKTDATERVPPVPAPAKLRAFAEAGGVAVVFPAPGGKGFEAAPADKAFRVTTWRQNDGPLANSSDGVALAVDQLRVVRRQPVAGTGTPLASFADGKPFLVREAVRSGAIYLCATLPATEWSDLAEGLVLVPLLQRLLAEGGQRLSGAQTVVCGEEVGLADHAVWQRVDMGMASTARREPRPPDGRTNDSEWEGEAPAEPKIRRGGAPIAAAGRAPVLAGVYRVGGRVVAVNRPPGEDETAVLDESRAVRLFGPVPVHLFSQKDARRERLQSEVWRSLLWVMLALLVAEAWLAMPAAGGRGWSPDTAAMADDQGSAPTARRPPGPENLEGTGSGPITGEVGR